MRRQIGKLPGKSRMHFQRARQRVAQVRQSGARFFAQRRAFRQRLQVFVKILKHARRRF